MATIMQETGIDECQSSWPLDVLELDKETKDAYLLDSNTIDLSDYTLEDVSGLYNSCCSSFELIGVSNATPFVQETYNTYGDHSDEDIVIEETNEFDHPFLNMEEQMNNIRNYRQEVHAKWTEKMNEAQRLSHFNRKVAVKILLSEAKLMDEMNTVKIQTKLADERCRVRVEDLINKKIIEEKESGEDSIDEDIINIMREAFTKEVRANYKKEDDCECEEALRRIRAQWRDIVDKAMEEMYFYDNSPVVLKNMSCMCVFIPEHICREYGENVYMRQMRVANQQRLLDSLRAEKRKFVNGPSEYETDPINA